MNLLADESIDGQIVDKLREDGHQVWYVAEMEPGISDEQVLAVADREKALLVTADKDFGELMFRQQQIPLGVVLLRLAGLSPERKAELVSATLAQHLDGLAQAFTVLTPGMLRIRRWPL